MVPPHCQALGLHSTASHLRVKRLKNFLYPKELLCETVLCWKVVETLTSFLVKFFNTWKTENF